MKDGHIGHIAFEKMSDLYDGEINYIDENLAQHNGINGIYIIFQAVN